MLIYKALTKKCLPEYSMTTLFYLSSHLMLKYVKQNDSMPYP